jgi:hypothetical protein
MSDQDLVLEALEQVQRILAEHYRPGAARRPELTFDQLLVVMDRQDLAAAQQRLKAGRGLRVVK